MPGYVPPSNDVLRRELALMGVASVRIFNENPDLTPDDTRIALMMLPQEACDLFETIAGRKPTYLIRGFGSDVPAWISYVRTLAERYGLSFVSGPGLIGENVFADAPDVIRENYGAARTWASDDRTYHYMTHDPTVLGILTRAFSKGGRTGIVNEARVLGYPLCCVRDHYDRHRRVAEFSSRAVMRATGGDPEKVRAFETDESFQLSESEQAEFQTHLHAAKTFPFSSVLYCPACAAEPQSPARLAAQETEAWMEALEPRMAHVIRLAHHSAEEE